MYGVNSEFVVSGFTLFSIFYKSVEHITHTQKCTFLSSEQNKCVVLIEQPNIMTCHVVMLANHARKSHMHHLSSA